MEKRMSASRIAPLVFFTVILAVGTIYSSEVAKGPDAMRQLDNSPALAATTDEDSLLWLTYDNGAVLYYFPIPDLYDDHYFNVRFTAPDSCQLIQAEFFFYKDSTDTTNIPDIKVLVWSSLNSLPNEGLDSLTFPSDSIVVNYQQDYIEATYVDLDSLNLSFSSGNLFHLGWEPADINYTDTLSIFADDGYPQTSTSCEYWGQNGTWGTIIGDWGLGVNFLIRAQVMILESPPTYVWLEPDQIPTNFALAGPYPNPFNPETSLIIQLEKPQIVSVRAYDISGRLVQDIIHTFFPAGRNVLQWKPQNLASGTYFLRLTTTENTAITRAFLIR